MYREYFVFENVYYTTFRHSYDVEVTRHNEYLKIYLFTFFNTYILTIVYV